MHCTHVWLSLVVLRRWSAQFEILRVIIIDSESDSYSQQLHFPNSEHHCWIEAHELHDNQYSCICMMSTHGQFACQFVCVCLIIF